MLALTTENFLNKISNCFNNEEVASLVKRGIDHVLVLLESSNDNLSIATSAYGFSFTVKDRYGERVFSLVVDSKYDGTDVCAELNGRTVKFEEAMETIRNHYNGSLNLKSDDYAAMMDLAIDTKDKEWFDELHRRQQKIS